MADNDDLKLGYDLYLAQSEMIRAGEAKREPWNAYLLARANVKQLEHAVKINELFVAGAREDYELRMARMDVRISEIFNSIEDPVTGIARVDMSIEAHREVLREMDEIRDDLTEAEAEYKRVLDSLARATTSLCAAHGEYQRTRGLYEAASVNLYNLLQKLPAA